MCECGFASMADITPSKRKNLQACLHAGRQFLPEETQADDGCRLLNKMNKVFVFSFED